MKTVPKVEAYENVYRIPFSLKAKMHKTYALLTKTHWCGQMETIGKHLYRLCGPNLFAMFSAKSKHIRVYGSNSPYNIQGKITEC